MKTVLVCLLLAVLGGPFVAFESLRFYTAHQTCLSTHAENERLLMNPLCGDAWQRHIHGPKLDATCKKAHDENLISPVSCAWQVMWKQGEPYRVWAMVTESYVMLALIVVPSSLLIIWLLFWSYTESSHRRQQLEMQKEMYRETLKAVQSSQQQQQQMYPNLMGPQQQHAVGGSAGDDDFIKLIRRSRYKY
jgi:hypothetical protein